jgi:aldose 1-epimerase
MMPAAVFECAFSKPSSVAKPRRKPGTSSRSRALLVAMLLATPACPAVAAPTAHIERFGIAEDGNEVHLVTLTNDNGMVVKISSRGGTITEILVPDRDGNFGNVVLGVTGFEAWEKLIGFNAITGRFANRIGDGGFKLDGTFYPLPGNPNTKVTLHGGYPSFSAKIFEVYAGKAADRAAATFRLVSPDGDNGFPGEVTLDAVYSLGNDDTLRIEYIAETTKPTVINLTNHAYFTLGTHQSGPIYDQILQVNASNWTPTDGNQVPTGEIRDVTGSPFDFRRPRPMRETIYSTDPQILLARGLDHNFVLDGYDKGNLHVAVRLADPASGRQLEVRTTEPGVQLFSTNGTGGTIDAGNGLTIRQSDALAIETQHFPDSPNKPHFPSTVLRPGETFRSVTEFAFSTDEQPFDW